MQVLQRRRQSADKIRQIVMRKHEQDAAMQRGRAQSISTISGTRAIINILNVAFPYPVSLINFCIRCTAWQVLDPESGLIPWRKKSESMREALFELLLRWELLQVHYSKINFFSFRNDYNNNDVFVYSTQNNSLNSQLLLYLLICLHFDVIICIVKIVFDPNLPHFY